MSTPVLLADLVGGGGTTGGSAAGSDGVDHRVPVTVLTGWLGAGKVREQVASRLSLFPLVIMCKPMSYHSCCKCGVVSIGAFCIAASRIPYV